MVRYLLGAAGAAGGLILGAMIRPSIFGEPVPYDVVLSGHPMDAPFRAQIVQTFSLTILGGIAVALLAGHIFRRFSVRARL